MSEDRICSLREIGHRAKYGSVVPPVRSGEHDEEILRTRDGHVHQLRIRINEPRLRAVLPVRGREQDDRSLRPLQSVCRSHSHLLPQPVRQTRSPIRCPHSFLQFLGDQTGLGAERRHDADQGILSDPLVRIGLLGMVDVEEVRVVLHDPRSDSFGLLLIPPAGTLPGVI